MTDIESARTGYTKLYHPRGPLVSMPVVGDTPKAMFDFVSAMLDAGFVVSAPGLEVGEEKEQVSGILRSAYEHDGEITDTLLLYAANEAMEWSFLKLYLDSDADKQVFESACGVKLDMLPVYEGKDKPKRDGTTVAKKYIYKLAKPVPVVFMQNPKWSEEEANAAKAKNVLYTKPKRVFVRWADAAPAQPAANQGPTELEVAEQAWAARLKNVIGTDDLNKLIPMVKAIVEDKIRMRAWTMCLEFADSRKWVLDKETRLFRHVAELPLTASAPTPVPQPAQAAPAAAPPPPATSAPPPPPPDDVSPLIAAWQKKLDPNTVNLAKLNGEITTAFKSIGRTDPDRGVVWVMLMDFAKANGCPWNQEQMKFVESMP